MVIFLSAASQWLGVGFEPYIFSYSKGKVAIDFIKLVLQIEQLQVSVNKEMLDVKVDIFSL